jgi:hypothetical protein
MLELRPNCEYCDKDLPPDAVDARICSYECTFCAECVDKVLFKVLFNICSMSAQCLLNVCSMSAQCLPELRRRVCAAPDPAG